MNIHELGGLAPTAYICESISPLALHTLTAGGGVVRLSLSLSPRLGKLGGILVTIVGAMSECLAACWDS